jgi:hypothetical protein
VSGKGDTPRPLSVPQEEFNARWDAIDWNARQREKAKPEALQSVDLNPALTWGQQASKALHEADWFSAPKGQP